MGYDDNNWYEGKGHAEQSEQTNNLKQSYWINKRQLQNVITMSVNNTSFKTAICHETKGKP